MRRIELSDMDFGKVVGLIDACRQHAIAQGRAGAIMKNEDKVYKAKVVTANCHELMEKLNAAETF